MMRWSVGVMRFPARGLLMLVICGLAVGCGGKSGPVKVTVTGKITLDGKPVPNGQVIFNDAAGAVAADSGEIKNGQFSFQSKLGSKKVSISSMQPTEKKAVVGGIPGRSHQRQKSGNRLRRHHPREVQRQDRAESRRHSEGSQRLSVDADDQVIRLGMWMCRGMCNRTS